MSDPLKIAICDDDPMEKQKLIDCINKSSIETDCVYFPSGQELLQTYRPEVYDLILMDIYMDGLTGIETITKIRQLDKDIPVAFITTSIEHTLESYRLDALKYIEKPYRQEEIEAILNLSLMQREIAPSLIIKKARKYEKLRLSKIIYLEQQTRQIIIHKTDGSIEKIYEKLSNLLPQIEGQHFLNCHKSYAVNLSHVKYVDDELRCFVMSDNTNIPIRRESYTKDKKKFEDFLFGFSKGV